MNKRQVVIEAIHTLFDAKALSLSGAIDVAFQYGHLEGFECGAKVERDKANQSRNTQLQVEAAKGLHGKA